MVDNYFIFSFFVCEIKCVLHSLDLQKVLAIQEFQDFPKENYQN